MLDGRADAQLSTVYHDFSPIPDPMLRKLELFNPCPLPEAKIAGALGAYDMVGKCSRSVAMMLSHVLESF
jgi:hypothetical protein